MLKYGDVLGLPVICGNDGKKIGMVKDVIFCLKTKKVKGFLLEPGRYETTKKIAMFGDVLNIGGGAVIINNCLNIKTVNKAGYETEFKLRGRINGSRIYSKSGEDLGIVKDVLFDINTGQIEGVEVSNGILQDIYQGRRVVPLFGKVEFSEEIILVGRDAMEEINSTGGGIKRKLFGEEGSE